MSGDGLFWAARLDAQGQVEFYRGNKPTPGAATYHGMFPRYLYLDDNGAVFPRTKSECEAIDAELAAQAAETEAARQAAEAARATEEATANAQRDARLSSYREAYAAATAQLCQLAGLPAARVMTMGQIQEAVMPLLSGPQAGTVNGLLTLLTNLEGKLCREDGADALDRV